MRDRIRELRRVDASQILDNPKNWRTHNDRQAKAIRLMVERIGFAGALLARELPDGKLMLIDGHLRRGIAARQGEKIPVLVLDVDEAEADELLATFDPIGAMAGKDDEKLDALIAAIKDEGVAAIIKRAAPLSNVIPESFQILVECRDETHQLALLTKLEQEGVKCRSLIS